jgi:ribosomal 30S subunit maturation factor RimM
VTTEGGTRWVCGALGKVHGLRGEMYLNLAPDGLVYLENGERFFVSDEKGGERPCAVTRAGGDDARPLVTLDLAATRDAAIALQGLTLLASGGVLEELPHYRVGDLLGRLVREQDTGVEIGEVVDVLAGAAHDVLELKPPDGGANVLVPLVEELVWEGDDGGLTVRAGLLETSPQGDAPDTGEARTGPREAEV